LWVIARNSFYSFSRVEEKQMSKARKTHRDHAKKNQRPLPGNDEIESQFEALLTPAITVNRHIMVVLQKLFEDRKILYLRI
jgi:hypothetical protein